jgi:hypothetical protein
MKRLGDDMVISLKYYGVSARCSSDQLIILGGQPSEVNLRALMDIKLQSIFTKNEVIPELSGVGEQGGIAKCPNGQLYWTQTMMDSTNVLECKDCVPVRSKLESEFIIEKDWTLHTTNEPGLCVSDLTNDWLDSSYPQKKINLNLTHLVLKPEGFKFPTKMEGPYLRFQISIESWRDLYHDDETQVDMMLNVPGLREQRKLSYLQENSMFRAQLRHNNLATVCRYLVGAQEVFESCYLVKPDSSNTMHFRIIANKKVLTADGAILQELNLKIPLKKIMAVGPKQPSLWVWRKERIIVGFTDSSKGTTPDSGRFIYGY